MRNSPRITSIHVILIGMIAVIIIAIIFVPSRQNLRHELKSNEYYGTLKTDTVIYDISISEVWNSDGSAIRIMHLHPQGEPSYVTITGHQYGCRTNGWDSVWYSGEKLADGHRGGCNSVVATNSGWKFEPCPSDKGRVEAFSESKVFAAMSLLDRAMSKCHNQDHVVLSYIWNEQTRSCEKVVDKVSSKS